MGSPSKSLSWFAVFNNPVEHGYSGDPETVCNRLRDEWIQESPTRSGAWVYCISKDGLHHVHMVLEDIKQMTFSSVKKSYAQGMHFEPTMGKKKEVEDYVNKVGKWEEKGEQIIYTVTHGEIKGNQGRRNDLHKLYEMIKDGMSDYQILEENPQFMNHLTKIERVRETLLYEEFRTKRRTDLRVEYWYGSPGSGKTSGVLNLYGDDKVYIVTDYLHPWDGYKGQDVVLFDDIDINRITVNDLLKWLDIYPLELPCRFSNKIACFTKVYITSNYAFNDLFRNTRIYEEEIYKALRRRIHEFRKIERPADAPDQFMKVTPEEAEELDRLFGKI